MDVSKLVKQDAEALSEFKRTKAPLGVIHPLHSTGRKPKIDQTPDLTITAASMKPVEKPQTRIQIPEHLVHCEFLAGSPKRPPEGQLAPKNFMPGFKRPQSAKEQREIKNIAEQVLSSLPLQVRKQAMHKKLSILTRKDVRTSTEEYREKIRRNLNTKQAKRRLKEDVRHEGGRVMAELDTAFTKLGVTETQYQAAKVELETLVDSIESQLWKEKTLSRFMNRAQVGEITLGKLRKMLSTQQIEREGHLIAMQKFVHGMKTWHGGRTQPSPSGLSFSFGDLERYVEETVHSLMPEERSGVFLYLELMKKHLQKGKMVETMPVTVLEKVVTDVFNKWDGERVIIESVIRDIEQAIAREEQIKAELKMGAGGTDLETRVIAEFINQYFDKLEESVNKMKTAVETVLERLKSGKEKPEVWGNIIKNMRESVELEDLEKEWKLLNQEAKLVKNLERKGKSPKGRRKKTPEKEKNTTKSNVGPGAKAFATEAKAETDTRNSVSFKNPLDSVTSLPKLEEDVEDAISILNPGKKPESTSKPATTSPSPPKSAIAAFLSKAPKEEDSKLAELRALKEMSPFQSLDLVVSKKRLNSAESVASRIVEMEVKRGTHRGKKVAEAAVETDATRAYPPMRELPEFSPYLDEWGQKFNPEEKFKQEREALRNHIDPRYVEEMLRRSPDPQPTWYVRPHHLKSVTYHPYSIEDNPDAMKHQPDFAEPQEIHKAEDPRASAVGYLEKTIEDLKCELEERRRKQTVDSVPSANSYIGWVGKAVESVSA